MNWRIIDWIWRIRGSLPLPPGQSGDDAFDRLNPLLKQDGTTLERSGDTLIFHKKDQAAQDKLSIFDGGILRVEPDGQHQVLHYNLTSRALLACFIAPLVFLAFAQFSVALSALHAGSDGADRSSERAAEEAAEDEEDKEVRRLHPIDKFLGAPEPEQPDEEDEDSSEDEEGEEAEEEKKMKHSPTRSYIFAGIFAAIYIVGRFLESWLVRRRFRRNLMADAVATHIS